jgi:hypothetical protein
MRVVQGLSRKSASRWVTLGLLTAGALMLAVVANARKPEFPGAFVQIESGINHAQIPSDSHHICGVGMNSLFGHFTTTVVLTKASGGLIEYRLSNGDAIYGTINIRPTTTPGVALVNVLLTKGTGQFEGKIAGNASGTLRYGPGSVGVQPYTLNLQGICTAFPRNDQT